MQCLTPRYGSIERQIIMLLLLVLEGVGKQTTPLANRTLTANLHALLEPRRGVVFLFT